MRHALGLMMLAMACSGGPTSGTCSPATCSGCCDATNQCVSSTSAQQCGSSGARCQTCSTGQLCSLGVCLGGSGGSSGGGSAGTGGGSSGTGGGSSGAITVSGHVRDYWGQTVANATVIVPGKSPVTSDAQGAFSIPGVTVPYTIATIGSSGATSYVTVIYAVTRTDPTLPTFGSLPTYKNGTVTGDLTGASFFGRQTRVLVDAPNASGTATPSSNPYSNLVRWVGGSTLTATLHALQWTNDGTGMPAAYNGYGKLDGVTLTDGLTASSKNITLNQVGSQTVNGTVVVPTGLTLMSKSLVLRAAGDTTTLGSMGGLGTTFSFVVPSLSNVTLVAQATASGQGRNSGFAKQGLANQSNVTLTLAAPPQLSVPLGGASGIDLSTQMFSWAPSSPVGLYQATMTSANLTVLVFTASTNFTMPATSDLGLGVLPTGTSFGWSVRGYGGGATTTDAFTGSSNLVTALAPATGDVWQADSETRSFQTR